MPEEYEERSNEDLETPPAFFPKEFGNDAAVLVEVDLEGIFESIVGGKSHPFVILTAGKRRLDIAIGSLEASAISRVIDGVVPERPYTHDLTRTIIESLGGVVHSVVIEDLWNDIFFAKVYVRSGETEHEIDARPSDALALAVRFDAPIYVSDRLFSE